MSRSAAEQKAIQLAINNGIAKTEVALAQLNIDEYKVRSMTINSNTNQSPGLYRATTDLNIEGGNTEVRANVQLEINY